MLDWKEHVRGKLAGLGLSGEREEDLTQELAQQMEDAYRQARLEGSSEKEALRRAKSEVDDWESLVHEVRSLDRPLIRAVPSRWIQSWETRPANRWLSGLADTFQDVRLVLRGIVQRPLLVSAIVLTLALGIGANTAVFSVLYGSWIRPLSFPEEKRLVRLFVEEDGRSLPVSVADFLDLQESSRDSLKLAAQTTSGVLLSDGGEWALAPATTVTPNFFDVLGLPLFLGRDFVREDSLAGASPVMILSYPFWKQRFASDPEIIGKEVQLSDTRCTVIGVAAPEFSSQRTPYSPQEARLYLPFTWSEEARKNRKMRWIFPLGRLAPGSSKAAAEQQLKQIYRSVSEKHRPERLEKGSTVALQAFRSWTVSQDSASFLMLAGAAGLVLLIACVNVANLSLVRLENRTREITIRAALGASRGRLARSFLTESCILTGLGCMVGVFSAAWGVSFIVAFYGDQLPRASQIGLQVPVLVFSVVLSLLTAILIGLVPTFRLRFDHLSERLKSGSRGHNLAGFRFREGLVAAQVALTIILVAGGGLLVHSFWNLNQVDLGVDLENVLSFQVSLPSGHYQEPTAIQDFYQRLEENLEGLPGVIHAGIVLNPPFQQKFSVSLSAAEDPTRSESSVPVRLASPGYFQTVGLPLTAGRIYRSEAETGPLAVPSGIVISSSLAKRLFPAEDALGKEILYSGNEIRIVGIVGDVREFGPDEPVTPSAYFPLQNPMSNMTGVVRFRGDFGTAAAMVQQTVAELEGDAPVWEIETLGDQVSSYLQDRRLALILISLFAGLALALATVGIYGVLAYMVTLRRREIGTRLALGAPSSAILRHILRKGLLLAGIGIPIGIVGAIFLGHLLRSLLWEVSPYDPLTLLSVTTAILLTLLAACLIPARRATRIDPLEALRSE